LLDTLEMNEKLLLQSSFSDMQEVAKLKGGTSVC
jgi:hypothetical protein